MWQVEGSNLAPDKSIFHFKSTKISSQKKKGTFSLTASVRAVAVGREKERSGGII